MTVYAYIRVSTDEQVLGTSLETQRPECAGVAMSNHLEIDEWLEDGGVSGTRPFFERCAEHQVVFKPGDVIICSNIDRFSRNAADCLNVLEQLKKIKVRLIINGHGDVTDDSNPMATFMVHLLAVFSDFYARDLRKKNIVGKRAKKRRGGYIGGTVPYGYRVEGHGRESTLVPIVEKKPLLTLISTLAHQTNERGRPFSARDVQKIVQAQFPDQKAPSHVTIHKMLKEARDAAAK